MPAHPIGRGSVDGPHESPERTPRAFFLNGPACVALALCLVPAAAFAQAGDAASEPEEEVQEPVDRTPPPPASEPAPVTRPRPTEPPPAEPPPAAAGTAGAPATPQPPVIVRTSRRAGAEEEEEEVDETDHYDFLIIELFGGVSYVDMRAVQVTNYYPEIVTLTGTGPAGGAALGFRIEFFTVGVRGAIAHYADEFDVGTAVAEVGLSLPIPVVKPYLRVGFGFGWHGDSDFMAPANSQTTVFGWAFSGAVGLDVYLADWFAIGAAVSIDVLNMNRQSTSEPVTDPGSVMFTDSGDAVGLQVRGQGAVSLHF